MLTVVGHAYESTVAAWDLQFFFLRLHFPIQIFVLHASVQCIGGFTFLWPLAHANFAYVFSVWSPVACNLKPGGSYTHMQIFPILHAHGGYLGSICMQLAAKQLINLACIAAIRMQRLHALTAIALQSS